MQIEIHEPEVGQRFMQQIQSGQFRNADELLTKALDALEKTAQIADRDLEEPAAAPVAAAPGRRHISEVICENMSRVPPEIMANMPADGASEHDHYIYGLPKRNP